ncbi:MAG: sulfatase-like hydrolase/transferase [Planctomycetota bacterium]
MPAAPKPSPLLISAWLLALLAIATAALAGPRPNIIHIFADDLGKGGIGIHGQNDRAQQGLPAIKTPHLDAMAGAGMTFNRAYAATVCSPSRGMLMTGFHQGHGHNDRNVRSLREQDVTVAHLLNDASYTTGVFGKWGYGASGGTSTSGIEHSDLRRDPSITNVTTLPTTAGYDEFTGYLNHGRAHKYFTSSLWTTDPTGNPQTAGISEQLIGNQDPNSQNNNLQAAYTHDLVAARSEQFVTDHHAGGEPFYMQLNYTIPHNDLRAIQFVPGWFDAYDDVDTSDWTNDERYYAAMITRMDASIGSLIDRLEDPNNDGDTSDSVMDETIILFTSDNGATQRDTLTIAGLNHFGINDTLRGGKRDLWEGGINVPLIVRWDGHVAAGATSDLPTDLADFMATAAHLAGADTPVGIDGVSIVPTLTGAAGQQAANQRSRGHLIFEHHEGDGPDPDTRDAAWAVVRGDEKLIRFDNGDYELFDLASDPSEQNPLPLTSPANAELRAELEAIAIAEGVNRPDTYANQFQTWSGADGDRLSDAAKWNGSTTGAPASNWSAVVNNTSAAASVARVDGEVVVLGLEVRGDAGSQTVRVEPGQALTGRNEVRVRNGGRIHLDQATLATARWIDVGPGGEVTGVGAVEGRVENAGLVAPGLPSDLPPATTGEPNGEVTTGVLDAVAFDFTGVQDDAPLTATSLLSEFVQVTGGLDFGPGLAPRNAADAGDEFNVQGFLNQTNTSSSLAAAIAAEDYLTFSVAPVAGLAMTLDTVTVQLWRNGNGAAEQYAVLTSVDGFTDDAAIGTLGVFSSGIANQHLLVGQYEGGQASEGAVEVRIYGWDANGGNGNTHFNAASLTASFESVDTVPLSPVGQLELVGSYTQHATGTLALTLSGGDNTDPLALQHDTLRVVGDASLDGTLAAEFAGGFSASLGDVFDVVTVTGERTGEFTTLALPTLAPALAWEVVYDGGAVSLLVIPEVTGDFNADGRVDAADFTVWRDQLGSTGRNLAADADGDSVVDADDYQLWRANFGANAAAQPAAQAPEPQSMLLLASLALAPATRQRHRRCATRLGAAD